MELSNIKINVSFHNKRCFFNGFNEKNDINPETHKAGVNFYKFPCIGRILEILGFAKGIHCYHNDQPKVVYINSKSFLKWRERHSNDEYITLSDTASEEYSAAKKQKVLNFGNKFEDSIKYILKSYKALSYREIIKKADRELQELELGCKERKISTIKSILKRAKYKEFYAQRKRPEIYLHNDQDPSFLWALPGIKFGIEK